MKIYIYNIYFILVISLITRILAFLSFSDTIIDHEWGYLLHNLSVNGVLGINFVDGDVVKAGYAEESQKVLPSVFMPPLYIYFIYFIKVLVGKLFNIAIVVIVFQISINLLSIFIFFKILKKFFNLKISLLFSFVFSVIPINIYASVQISSITLQIFLIIIYLFFFL